MKRTKLASYSIDTTLLVSRVVSMLNGNDTADIIIFLAAGLIFGPVRTK
jgi:hypothetical protein